jgi:uncharacterized protein (DUF169 family)
MMKEPMKIAINFSETSEILKRTLGLSGSPVAVAFASGKEDIPEGIPELDKTIRHCSMMGLARKEGKCFYATAERHECNGGGWALGLKDLTPSLRTGEFYFRLGKFASAAACRRTIDHVPHLPSGYTYATLYAPLENTLFTPQVILIVTSPRNMLKLAQSSLFRTGGRIHAEFSGIQSVCSDACAQVFLGGTPNFSMGCDGSRRFSGIGDDEMVMGIPAEMLPELIHALGVVTAAPGSK